jgi:Ribosomal proteins 50S-L18Ae/60S-L20/60S-L18A
VTACFCLQIFEKKPTATKNYGIWLRFQSRTGYHNMFKEFRDLTLNGAIEQVPITIAASFRFIMCHFPTFAFFSRCRPAMVPSSRLAFANVVP